MTMMMMRIHIVVGHQTLMARKKTRKLILTLDLAQKTMTMAMTMMDKPQR